MSIIDGEGQKKKVPVKSSFQISFALAPFIFRRSESGIAAPIEKKKKGKTRSTQVISCL